MTAETVLPPRAEQIDGPRLARTRQALVRAESRSWLGAVAEAVGFARGITNREV